MANKRTSFEYTCGHHRLLDERPGMCRFMSNCRRVRDTFTKYVLSVNESVIKMMMSSQLPEITFWSH